jgi:hypothetical protein
MPLIAQCWATLVVATEDPKIKCRGQNGPQGSRSTRTMETHIAWYQLGIIYDQEGDTSQGRSCDRRTQQKPAKPAVLC